MAVFGLFGGKHARRGGSTKSVGALSFRKQFKLKKQASKTDVKKTRAAGGGFFGGLGKTIGGLFGGGDKAPAPDAGAGEQPQGLTAADIKESLAAGVQAVQDKVTDKYLSTPSGQEAEKKGALDFVKRNLPLVIIGALLLVFGIIFVVGKLFKRKRKTA